MWSNSAQYHILISYHSPIWKLCALRYPLHAAWARLSLVCRGRNHHDEVKGKDAPLVSSFVFIFFPPCFSPLFIPLLVPFSLLVFPFKLHSSIHSINIFNLILFFPLIYLFNLYILRVDIFIYFIIHVIHFYFFIIVST